MFIFNFRSRTLNEDLSKATTELVDTTAKLSASNAQIKSYEAEMTAINELSSQILTGFTSQNDIDLDSLTDMLEENRELLSDMVTKPNLDDSSHCTSALPKTLFDIILQANGKITTRDANSSPPSAKDIAENLPKVWRILMEFINHQPCIETPIDENDIEEKNGAMSVSSTFIRLKDLILEKRNLQKETNRLKNLNEHLDKRLKSQEKRLGVVSCEVTKTWHLVGRMQRQYRQLHTNEQILRYQLQQKRRMLNVLKEELEYCRKKWAQAKEKNNESAVQMKSLQKEFADRKIIDACYSGESGYSDDEDTPPLTPRSYTQITKVSKENCMESEQKVTQSPQPSSSTSLSSHTLKPEHEEDYITCLTNVEEPSFSESDPLPESQNSETNNGELSETNILNGSPNVVQENIQDISNEPTIEEPIVNLTQREIEYTERRNARLRRLEEQCQQLLSNISTTVNRGDEMSSQLSAIHDRYSGVTQNNDNQTLVTDESNNNDATNTEENNVPDNNE